MQAPKRKRNRLENYDYSQSGAYFITICTHDKKCILGGVVGCGVLDAPQFKLSKLGNIAESTLIQVCDFYENIYLAKYVIMPNHIHFILHIESAGGTSRTPSPTNAILPSLISTYKRFVSKNTVQNIWQRSYHDRVIRDEREYQKIWKYIDTNPVKWEEDTYFQKS